MLLIRSTRYIGYAPTRTGDGWRVIGQDGGQSIPTTHDTLFLFSDTLLAIGEAVSSPAAPITQRTGLFLPNCAALSAEHTFLRALKNLRYFSDPLGRPREVIRATLEERTQGYRFWPQHGLENAGRVYLFYIGIRHFDPATTWGFEPAGTGLAVLDLSTGDCQRIRCEGEWRLWSALGGLHFGVQVIRGGEWIYAFSSRQDGPFSAAILSRVQPAAMADPRAWRHLAATTPEWSQRLEDACELAYVGPEFSVSWNDYRKQYLMVYVDGYSKTLQLRTSEHLWGPYSEPYSAGVLPHRPESELLSLGFEHPAFATGGGKTIFISYCQPRFTQNSLVAVTLHPRSGSSAG